MLDLTSHTAVPTTFILDEEGELMASFSTTNKVILVAFSFSSSKCFSQGGRLCRGGAEGGGRLQGVRLLQRLVSSSKRNYCCGTNPGRSIAFPLIFNIFLTDVQDSCLTSDMDVKKPSANAEEKKEKKEANAMDDIQPHDSISNVSPN